MYKYLCIIRSLKNVHLETVNLNSHKKSALKYLILVESHVYLASESDRVTMK